MLQTLAISNYRSIKHLVLPLDRLNIVTGPNGSGKSNLYRGLRLLAETARGDVASSLAREGGLPSTFWAGPQTISRDVRSGKYPVQGTVKKGPAQLRLGFGADDLSYAVDLGYPSPDSTSAFSLDPEIKLECIWAGPVFRRGSLLVDRRGPLLRATNHEGNREVISSTLSGFESMMRQYSDPRAAPEMIAVREQLRAWRFYDHFRTDREAPCRMPQIGTHTPIMADDGADLAAALQTIREIGNDKALSAAVKDAFPGSTIEIVVNDGWFEVVLRQHGLLRPLKASELSDGTLRYLLLTAALLTPRPPELLVLNEPETSLHPELIPALTRLILSAAEKSQVIVVSHNDKLVELLKASRDATALELKKELGETQLVDQDILKSPRWEWPSF
jgi:predicted ATPase